VVSSDLGAPGDSTSVTCTTSGDQGLFRLSPSCASSTLEGNATYISNVGGTANYTGNLADVLACITPLGDTGCGFGHQLGSIARALGADGAPAPARNAGFLRPEADLAIIILSNADDCSAPPTTVLYSLNGGPNNISNGLGPMARYRCNEFGHLCIDPSGDPQKLIQPPATAPTDAQGTTSAPTLSLTNCESLDKDGLLTPVSTLVDGIKALKPDLVHQIFVGAIVAPAAPYTVDWVAPGAGQNVRPGELWPQIEHSCGSGDGSFGDPAVRITQLVNGFGHSGVSTSICGPSYGSVLAGLVAKIGNHLQGPSGGGDSGTGGGGAVPTDAGSGVTGGGGVQGDSGSGGSSPSVKPIPSGLKSGGCDIGASGPGAWGLTLLVAVLIAGRRRRRGAGRA
jgi:MYXO-CTERM domain-containing protein